MIPLFDLRCSGCARAYPAPLPAEGAAAAAGAAGRLPAVCPDCGAFWRYGDRLRWRSPDPSAGPPGSLRRWASLLGLEADELRPEAMGRPLRRLGRSVRVAASQQGSGTGGSFKERGAEVLAAACARRGLQEVFLDSSGNAGLAMARATAERGIACRVLVPETTPADKLERLRALGARVEVVPGDRRAASDAARRLVGRLPYASHVVQPFFHAGVATLAWDLAEEVAEAAEPPVERVLLPVGNGSLLLGLELGFGLLVRAGRVERMPALHAVQLAGFASLAPGGPGVADATRSGTERAAGIAIADPPRRREMAAAVEGSGGDVTVVTDGEVARARGDLADEGLVTDATGATAWAGFGKRPELAGDGTVVVLTSVG